MSNSSSCAFILQPDRKAFFNQRAHIWDEKFCTHKLQEFLCKFISKFNIKPGQRVLDIGTGTGILIPHLVKAVGSSGSIIAVDFAEKMIEICKEKFSSFPNVKIGQQNVESLSFQSEYFDVAICFGLFPHIENKEKALSRINHVLKKEGKLIIAHALSSNEIRQHHRGIFEVANDVLPDEQELRNQLTSAGFNANLIEDIEGSYLCIATKTSYQNP